jgi:hypothetical protein
MESNYQFYLKVIEELRPYPLIDNLPSLGLIERTMPKTFVLLKNKARDYETSWEKFREDLNQILKALREIKKEANNYVASNQHIHLAHGLLEDMKIIHRIPLLGTVYRVSQKLLKLFHDDNDNKITDVVFIEYPKPDLWVPAYVTNRMDSMLVVYVPTSPNPTSGFTIMVDESKVIQTQLSIEEVSSFIISLGADLPQSEDVLQLLQRTSNRLGRSTPNGALT